MTDLRHVIAGAVGPELTDHLLERLAHFGYRIVSDAELAAIRKKALEEAAQIADPPLMHRKGKPGLWRRRRAQIAADIRDLKDTAAADGRKAEASE